jgi:hypothetical protein
VPIGVTDRFEACAGNGSISRSIGADKAQPKAVINLLLHAKARAPVMGHSYVQLFKHIIGRKYLVVVKMPPNHGTLSAAHQGLDLLMKDVQLGVFSSLDLAILGAAVPLPHSAILPKHQHIGNVQRESQRTQRLIPWIEQVKKGRPVMWIVCQTRESIPGLWLGRQDNIHLFAPRRLGPMRRRVCDRK